LQVLKIATVSGRFQNGSFLNVPYGCVQCTIAWPGKNLYSDLFEGDN